MGIEIERKFLVVGERWRAQANRRVAMDQGYLSGEGGRSSFRVRTQGRAAESECPVDIHSGERPATDGRAGGLSLPPEFRHGWQWEARLNIKAAVVGHTRAEYDYGIPVADAREILDKLCVGRLTKTRHYIEFAGHTWEVDEFLGDNQGLVVAELELDTADAVFERPDWLGAEVTDDRRYYNHHLALHPYKTWKRA